MISNDTGSTPKKPARKLSRFCQAKGFTRQYLQKLGNRMKVKFKSGGVFQEIFPPAGGG